MASRRRRGPGGFRPRARVLAVVGCLLLASLAAYGSAFVPGERTSMGLAGEAGTSAAGASPSLLSPHVTFPAPPAGAASASSSSPRAGAGSVLRSILPNYNGSLPGNFPSSVAGWQVGSPAYVPSTGDLWLPERAVSVGGLPAPNVAPAVEFNANANRFVGIALSVENTSAFLFDPVNDLLYSADYANASVGVLNATTGAWLHPAIPVGADPVALALDPATNSLYVANAGSNNITVIDASSNTVANGGIPTGLRPAALAFDAADGFLFIADSGDRLLRSVNVTTDGSGPSITLQGTPAGVAYSRSSGTVGVTVPSKSQIVILNATVLAPQAVQLTGIGSAPVATTANGTEYIVGNSSGSNLVIVNSSSGAILDAAIGVGSNLTSVVVESSGSNALVWSTVGRNVSTVNLVAHDVTARSPTLGSQPASSSYDPVTNELFVTDSFSSSVIVLNATTGRTALAPLHLGAGVASVAVDPATGTVYVGLANAVDAVDPATGQLLASDSGLTGSNSALLVDPGDGLLWLANGPRGLVALHLAGLTPAYSIDVPTGLVSQQMMTLDPAVSELFVVNTSSGELEVVDSASGGVVVPALFAGTGVSSVAYDAADGAVYALGTNISVIDPTTNSVVGAPIPLPTHVLTTGLAFDPTRELLYASMTTGGSSNAGVVSVLDGSSVVASRASVVSMAVGEMPFDPDPVTLVGSTAPAAGALIVANTHSGTLSEIATLPQITFLSASPSTVDVNSTTHVLLGYVGGTGPVSVAYSGLPPGCLSADVLSLNCTPAVNGSYTLAATVTDSLGHAASASTNLTVGARLTALLALTPGPLPALDAGGSLSAQVTVTGGIPSYGASWDFGDGGTATGLSVVHAYSTAGTYLLTVTVADSTGRTVSVSSVVEVQPRPVTAVSASPGNATDVGQTINLSAIVSGGSGASAEEWTFGDGTTATGLNVSHSWNRAGRYAVLFDYQDARGAYANRTENVTVNPDLSGTFYAVGRNATDSVPVGTGVEFRAAFQGGTPPYSVDWSFGDGSSASGVDVAHTYGGPGAYSINVTLVDAAGARVFAKLPFTITPASPTALGSGSSLAALFLGLVVGGTIAAVVLHLAHRSRRRPPHPPSPYVPPANVSVPPWRE